METLPEGWKCKKDPSSGKYYYVSRKLRRTTWTKPEDEPKPLRRKVSSDLKCLENLRSRGFAWVPGEDNIRPTSETREKKLEWLKNVVEKKYQSRRDFVLHDLFGCETKRNREGVMFVDEESLKSLGKKRKLYPNMFPYDLPSGTIHYIMWYTWTRPEDSEITNDIANSLGKGVDFVWYENPKMSIPGVFHVQVFAKRRDGASF